MRYFVKETQTFHEECKKHNNIPRFERLKERIENDVNYQIPLVDVYKFTGMKKEQYLKKEQGNFRTVFAIKKFMINGLEVGCLLALRNFIHGGKESEYTAFHGTNTPAAERDALSGLSRVDWTIIEKEITQTLNEKPELPPPPALSNSERAFLDSASSVVHVINNDPVFETKQWAEKVQDEEFSRFYEVAIAINTKIYDSIDSDNGLYSLPIDNDSRFVICYYMKGDMDRKDSWFLQDIGSEKDADDWKKQISSEDNVYAFLSNLCRRAYPQYILDDPDFWSQMEKDKDSNFILSEEEAKIISIQHDFPLFISGRAGSGKSTVLQYMFASFQLQYISCKGDEDLCQPVYLSYSENLIKNAKKLSTSLFSNNHAYTSYLKKDGKSFKNDVEPLFEKSFFVFQDLIKHCISQKNPTIVAERFPSGKYISYTKFREQWTIRFGHEPKASKEYGPAISWHVIRTYIKGWSSDGYLTPEDYADPEFGSKNKTVTDKTFQQVFTEVWTNWYQKLQEKEGYWDDQDLVRYCLSPDDQVESYVTQQFSAILCDESQDFTRIETDFILSLSVYTKRLIQDETMIRKIPFIFAGDEFQTLNPTGFSWDMLRSYLTTRLGGIFNVNFSAPDTITLTKNYRSTGQIVKLGNRLQLLRETRCGSSPTQPQTPYYSGDAASIYCLPPSKQVWQKLKEMGVILIVPSSDGQSPKDFVEHSPIKGMLEFYPDGSPKDITIYNPIQAKGQDYPCVAVYGFDDASMDELKLKHLLQWFKNDQPQRKTAEENELELKYHLSNAYVSATRAKNKLFVISSFDEKSFWSFAFSTDKSLRTDIGELQELMLHNLSRKYASEWHDGILGYIMEGDVSDITNENIRNPEENAKNVEEQGRALGDAGLMRQAAARYRERGKTTDTARCEAIAYVFEEQYQKAAESFRNAEEYDEAVNALWKACAKSPDVRILKIVAEVRECHKRLEVIVATLAIQKEIVLSDLKRRQDDIRILLEGQNGTTEAKTLQARECVSAWTFVANECLRKMEKLRPSQKLDVKLVLDLCEKLSPFGVKFDYAEQARKAFDAELFDQAVPLWEKSGVKPLPKEYHKAQTIILPYPRNLEHFAGAGDAPDQHIVDAYLENRSVPQEPKERKLVGRALLECGEAEDILQFLPFILTEERSRDEGQRHIDQAIRRKTHVNNEILNAVLDAKWTDLQRWTPKLHRKYVDARAKDVLAMIEKLKSIRAKDFSGKIHAELSARRVVDVMEEQFKNYSSGLLGQLLLTDLGKILEMRGHNLDAVRFYEWAERQSNDPVFKHEIAIRRYVQKKKQADHDNNEEHQAEAEQMFAELNVPENTVFPDLPQFTRWEKLFSEMVLISSDEDVPKGREQEKDKKKKDDKKQTGIPVPAPAAMPSTIPLTSENPLVTKTLAELKQEDKKAGDNAAHVIPIPVPVVGDDLPVSPAEAKEEMPVPEEEPVPQVQAVVPQTKTADTGKKQTQDKVVENKIRKLCLPEYPDYCFRFNRAKFELRIDYKADSEPEGLQIKIKKGEIPDDEDFIVQNDRLIKPSGEATPFAITATKDSVTVDLLDETGNKTGMAMVFNR